MKEPKTFSEKSQNGSGNNDWLRTFERTLNLEIEGLRNLQVSIDGDLGIAFSKTIELISNLNGRIIVSGVGKSGHVAKKFAATLASTGTPAYFVHANEASHGDLGMITQDDSIIALSWSGETAELASIISYSRRFKVPLIAITSGKDSTLSKAADIIIQLPSAKEACPNGLAPTTSAIMQMALGDALAMALLEARGFSAGDFKVFHPGGRLGANLKQVRDIMHVGESIPIVARGTLVRDAIVLISEKGFGCVGVLDRSEKLVGIITDGDLRRHLNADILNCPVEEIMSSSPISVPPDKLVGAALELVNSSAITTLFVVESDKPVGIVHLHDLLRVGAA